ncbi:hypothetical protein C9374_005282 [Naegleria lovaniensis]|uniref:DUF4116 domain-containing protein n=1 Tax=Naegleria lovaniensis TaxID=51637 RepID=A0AA88GQY7_NAELO|nr:uncharacterized protein C9374_005282 [Naegleria lovaniensis]KAG2382702.1 hypothetical protein C9374_005282 [Naegleria lovaniensis]
MRALRISPSCIQHVDAKFRGDNTLVKKLFELRYHYISLCNTDLCIKQDREIVKLAIETDSYDYRYAHYTLRTDKELTMLAVSRNGSLLALADTSLRQDREIVMAAVRNDPLALEYASYDLKDDYEVVEMAIKRSAEALKHASKRLRSNRDLVLKAFKHGPDISYNAFSYICDSLKKDKEIVLNAVKNNGLSLQYAHSSLQCDREIVLAAVKQNGEALEFASEELRKDSEIIREAILQNGKALDYVCGKIDKPLIILAAKTHYQLAESIDRDLLNDDDIALEMLQCNSYDFRNMDKRIRYNRNYYLLPSRDNPIPFITPLPN